MSGLVRADAHCMNAEIMCRGLCEMASETMYCLQPAPTKYRIGKEKGISICTLDCRNLMNFRSPDRSEVFAIAGIPNESDLFICSTRLGDLTLYDERLSTGKVRTLIGSQFPGSRSLIVSSKKMLFGGSMKGKVFAADLSNHSGTIKSIDDLVPNKEVECKLNFDNTEKLVYVLAGQKNVKVYNVDTGHIESIYLPKCNNYSPLLNLDDPVNGVIYENKYRNVNILQHST
ncbi:hypothetical protein GJ496_005972 [Pomphorhynchus laevis]|nr:hypothetical protein GJ496_005972 [Pomphorhynchus laevis]